MCRGCWNSSSAGCCLEKKERGGREQRENTFLYATAEIVVCVCVLNVMSWIDVLLELRPQRRLLGIPQAATWDRASVVALWHVEQIDILNCKPGSLCSSWLFFVTFHA